MTDQTLGDITSGPELSDADMLSRSGEVLDPLADIDENESKNRAKVGSARPSSLLYTYGPGAIMDLPNFAVMPAGLDDWERIYKRRDNQQIILEPRLLDVVRTHLGSQVDALRPFPWQPTKTAMSKEGEDLGIPARVFPQWMRCTGCDILAPITRFTYVNTHPYRPDLAQFVHKPCPGRSRRGGGGQNQQPRRKGERPAVPARFLLTCTNGHLDEFPYEAWVHDGKSCTAEFPQLELFDPNIGQGTASIIKCRACDAQRGMTEAVGESGKQKLPQKCRGRHPHLNAFDRDCDAAPTLISMGASNLWFPSIQTIVVMPRSEADKPKLLVDLIRGTLEPGEIVQFSDQPTVIRALANAKGEDLSEHSDDGIATALKIILSGGESDEELEERRERWDPIELLIPEWAYLQRPALFPQHDDGQSLMVTQKQWSPTSEYGKKVAGVVAVDRLKKVNAVIGFTRIDEMDRVNDLSTRLVKLNRSGRATWVPATEDLGEGIFLQFDLDEVDAWEKTIVHTQLWDRHKEAHHRNFTRRFSQTAAQIDPELRFPPPRYWLLHTLAHALIREMAMSSGYGAASLTERIYAWTANDEGREPAAGLLICTTSSDSEGTLGGLVALSEQDRLESILLAALRRASRCSSDPVCAQRTPTDPEDFLHGAACHCCSFASETSCEKANRFLDRRLLVTLPSTGEVIPGFFGTVSVR